MQSKGEYRVGIDFNPSGNDLVTHIKSVAAGLIDLIDGIPVSTLPLETPVEDRRAAEVARLKAHAQTLIEDGCRAAVAAATKPEPKP